MYEFIFAQNDKTNKKFIRKSYEVKRHLNITALHTLFEAVYDSGYSFVAESLGFSSPGYFSSVYKRETGYSPSQINPKA